MIGTYTTVQKETMNTVTGIAKHLAAGNAWLFHRAVEVGRDLWRSSSPTLSGRSVASYKRMPEIVSNQVLSTSKHRDPATSLGNLYQYSIILRVKKSLFLCLNRISLYIYIVRLNIDIYLYPEIRITLLWILSLYILRSLLLRMQSISKPPKAQVTIAT